MRKRYRELILSSIAQRIRTEIGAPKALNAPLVEALSRLKQGFDSPRERQRFQGLTTSLEKSSNIR